MVMYPTYAHPVEFEVIARTRNFKDMHPTMRERLQALMEDSGGKVGWGQGVRTPQQQLQLFLRTSLARSQRNDHLERREVFQAHRGARRAHLAARCTRSAWPQIWLAISRGWGRTSAGSG